MSNSTEITKVQVIIRRFLWETRDVVNDSESSRRWLENFRNTLQFQDLNDNPEPYALTLLSEARKFNEQQLRKQQTRWVRESLKKEGITNPTKEQIETRWAELYGNETTADGNTREDSLNVTDGSNAALLESGASANHYGVAPHREAGDVSANDSNISSEKDGSRQNRRTGAEPRGVSHSAPVRLPSFDEFTRFVDQQGLDYTDAREWWEMTMVDREGKDRDGKPIRNWKGALKRFCTTKTANRRSA